MHVAAVGPGGGGGGGGGGIGWVNGEVVDCVRSLSVVGVVVGWPVIQWWWFVGGGGCLLVEVVVCGIRRIEASIYQHCSRSHGMTQHHSNFHLTFILTQTSVLHSNPPQTWCSFDT